MKKKKKLEKNMRNFFAPGLRAEPAGPTINWLDATRLFVRCSPVRLIVKSVRINNLFKNVGWTVAEFLL